MLAARIVSRVHSDELVGLHRLVIAESARFPELAMILHSSGDARHIARLAEHIRAERGSASEPLAEPLFSLLLGEKHRRRLLGIDQAPSAANFILGYFGNRAIEVRDALRDKAILVRDRSYEIPGGVRITAGTLEQAQRVLDELERIW